LSGSTINPLPKDNIDLIIENMKKISEEIESRVKTLDVDVISTRNDPTIKNLWNKLCILHMKGTVICEQEYGEDKPGACGYIYQPQACIQVLHLTEEQTCCNRLYKRLP